MVEYIDKVGLELVEAYVLRRNNMVVQCYLLWTYVSKWFRGLVCGSLNSDGNMRG